MYHSQNFTHPLSSVPSPHYNISQTTRLTTSITKTGLNSYIFHRYIKNLPRRFNRKSLVNSLKFYYIKLSNGKRNKY